MFSINTRRGYFFRQSILWSLVILLVMVTVPSPVYAAAGWNINLTRLTATPVDSGTAVDYELQVECSAVGEASCNNGQITLNIPDDILDVLHLIVQLPNPLIQSVTLTPDGAIIDLIDAFPAGSSGTILFSVTPANGITPDGYTWTVDAEISADNTDSSTDQSDGSSTATPHLGITKWGPGGPQAGQVLLLDSPIIYSLVPCVDGAVTTGDLWLENATLTDTLPAEAIFQSATGGGSYDPIAHTITWSIPGPIEPSRNCSVLDITYQVTVEYPGTIAPLPYFATNSVELTGTPIGETAPITVSDTFTHSVNFATTSGTFSKEVAVLTTSTFGDYNVPAYAGDFSNAPELYWYMRIRNTGNIAIGYEIIDNVPCLDNNIVTPPNIAYQSFTDGTLCANPAFVTESVYNYSSHIQPAYDAGWRAEYITNAGTTGIFEAALGLFNGYLYPSDLPGDEIIARVIIPYHPLIQIVPSGTGYLRINGHIVEDDPVGLMPAGARVNNIADVTYYAGGSPVVSGSNGSGVLIVAPEIVGYIYKQNGSTLPPSGLKTWYISAKNNSTEAVPVVITDLLPAGMSFNEASPYLPYACTYTFPSVGCSYFDESVFNLEVIPNYAGTGRELVRLSSLPGHDIPPLTQIRFWMPRWNGPYAGHPHQYCQPVYGHYR